MRRFKLLLILLLSLFLSGCLTPPETDSDTPFLSGIPSPTPSFEDFTDRLFCDEICEDTISLHYSLATPDSYGISDIPITLGSVWVSVSPDADALSYYEQLLGYDFSTLNEEEQTTFRVLERHLNLLLSAPSSPYLSELLGPVSGFQAQLPLLLAEYRFDDIADVEQYLALLPKVYDYFMELSDFEKKKSAAGYFMDDTTARGIIRQCESFIKNPDENFLLSTFGERLSALDLPLPQETEYLLQNQNALYSYLLPAYELLVETLNECLGTGKNPYGMCYFDQGKEYYSLLVRMSTGSDKSMDELRQLLSDNIATAYVTLADALSSDSSLYLSAVSPSFPETDPNAILSYVIRQSEQDFPFVDCGNYEIKYIPEPLQEHVSPAMYLVPPIDRYEPNVIYINPSPEFDQNALYPTMVHEGYPGHLYQTVSSLSAEPNALRYLLTPTGYKEGWATYVEHYCYKYTGFSDTLTAFLQADQTISLCLYALSDIYIHYDGYTPEQLSVALAGYGFPKETSDLIYQTLLAEPTSYLPYAVGFLEFLELRDTAKSLWGADYSDYRFHSFLLEAGPLPFSFLKEKLSQ
ncbi:MAG: DUF885 domain-containing protein [Lachnospiraceae bacterium]|nr:DUF885 domain-containing protein [Lachnospiraceae bacterium]